VEVEERKGGGIRGVRRERRDRKGQGEAGRRRRWVKSK
jgi:hypothetical protein